MAEERRALDGYQEFVEPRQLTLDRQDPEGSRPYPRQERSLSRERGCEAGSMQDPFTRPYADLESTGYPSPGQLPDPLDFNSRGDGRSPFLWSGDYGANMLDPCPEFLLPPLDDWGARADERTSLGYDTPSLPPFGFSGSFPVVSGMLGQPPSLSPPGPTLPPLHSFAPLSPFSYGANSMDMLQPPPRLLHLGQPELDGGNQLPLLPSLGSYLHDYEEHRILQDPPPPPVETSKKTRVDRRNTKPLTVEDLLHDNSRFAKVVKAFLSIEDQENRTVPEIAKRVSEMYAGQYADFEGVKRMVNDVLQKHKAFWHPGRGSPYQLNLNEGRARREFPSNSRRLVRNRYDENLFYPRSKKSKKSRQSVKRLEGPTAADSSDPPLLQDNLHHLDEGELGQMLGSVEPMKSVEHRDNETSFDDEYDINRLDHEDICRTETSSSTGRLRNLEVNTLAQDT